MFFYVMLFLQPDVRTGGLLSLLAQQVCLLEAVRIGIKFLSLSSVRFGREYRWTPSGCSTGRPPTLSSTRAFPSKTTGWRP